MFVFTVLATKQCCGDSGCLLVIFHSLPLLIHFPRTSHAHEGKVSELSGGFSDSKKTLFSVLARRFRGFSKDLRPPGPGWAWAGPFPEKLEAGRGTKFSEKFSPCLSSDGSSCGSNEWGSSVWPRRLRPSLGQAIRLPGCWKGPLTHLS